MKFICDNITELSSIAKNIIEAFPEKRVFPLYGKMGAGKTTLTKELCDALHVIDTVNSPTFAIINEYLTHDDQHIYHFDCYRLKNINEFVDIGGVDYFYSGNYCFIEWPQIIDSLLPEDCIKINIEVADNNKQRIITIVK